MNKQPFNVSNVKGVGTGVKNVASKVANTSISFAKENAGLVGTVLVILIIVGIMVLYGMYKDYSLFQNNNIYIFRGTRSGSDPRSVSGTLIPMSSDQRFGLEFSYAFWIWIDPKTYSRNNTGQPKHIFHKGSPNAIPNMAPGVWLDGNHNILKIYMNTTKNQLETCSIPNIPMKKWLHVSIVVIGRHIDVYLNGQFKKRCTLEGIPLQNYGDVYMSLFGGFDGFMSQFRYFRYALPYYRLEQLVADGPDQAPCVDTGETPPYFSPNYFLNSVQGGNAVINPT